MKKYALLLLLVPVVLGALDEGYMYQTVHSPTDDIVALLGPLLSPAASIVLPTENATLFSALTRRYIQRFEPDIAVIVRVGTESDVAVIVEYASKSGRAILTASARHGSCVSMNNVRDAIMIDITPLSTIVIDAAANTMTVGGGVTIGGVLAAVRAAGKEATAGVCDCVGYLGASLGGGRGRLQGLHGLMADNIISARLVTANGEIVTVSDESREDLFWGLKGAGHNFGIVTSAVYRIYDETNGGLQFNAEMTYASDQLEALFAAIDGFARPAETSMFVLFAPGPDMKPIIALSFSSYSPEDSARSQFDSVFGHLPHLTRAESMVPSDKMNTVGALGVGGAACTSSYRKNYFGASLTRYNLPTVRAVFTSYAAFLTAAPSAIASVVMWETYSMQGVQAVPADSTAYPHREERHVAMLVAGYPDWTLDSVAETWLRNATTLLHRTSGFEKPTVYLNYAQGDEGLGAMYGYEQWRLDRLAALKRKYDQRGMFNAYHPIPSE